MSLFERQLAKGKVGEGLVCQYLQNKGWEVEDTTENPAYFKKDIDFLVKKDNLNMAIEVKTEAKMNQTGNMYIEDKLVYEDGREADGWWHYCEADYMWHVNPATQTAFVYRADEMKKYITWHYCRYARCNDGFKEVYGYLVPVEKYKQTDNWWQVVDLREIF